MKNTDKTRVVTTMEEWNLQKPLAPFGQLPYLEIKSADGEVVKISQTIAIGI